MFEIGEVTGFVVACLLLVLTPGPNMIYLISRSLCQGRPAGIISLCGVMLGVMVHMLFAVVGVSAVFLAIPLLYKIVQFGGAAYLLWLAWDALRPNARSPFEVRRLSAHAPRQLFVMGLTTSLLNPKVAIFYLSLFPQFVDPERGSVFMQSLIFGIIQNSIAVLFNLLFVLCAASVSTWFNRHALWREVHRQVMGMVLAIMALRLALGERR